MTAPRMGALQGVSGAIGKFTGESNRRVALR
jgi:hypothetical protein